jgi:hypothetical protein
MTSNDAVLAVVDALDSLSVPYIVVGSFSANVYGLERTSLDADFVVELGDISIAAVARRLGAGFRLDPQMSFPTDQARPGQRRIMIGVAQKAQPQRIRTLA